VKGNKVRDTTLTITIGRNIKGEPMANKTWQNFANEVESLIKFHDSTIHVGRATAVGLWLGIAEDNFTWVVGVEPTDVASYFRDIELIRKGYSQDAIAVTVGQTALVGQDTAEYLESLQSI
jgi:hypothetical protein